MEQLYACMNRIEGKVDSIGESVNEVKLDMAGLPCPLMTDRVNRLQKVVYGAVAVVLIGALGATGTVVFSGPKQVIIHQRGSSGGVSSGTQIADMNMVVKEEECK